MEEVENKYMSREVTGSPRDSPRRSLSRSRSRSLPRDSRRNSRSGSRSPVNQRSESPRGRERERFVKKQPAPEPSNVLGVFGLSHMTRQRDLEDIFGKFGGLKEAVLVMDKRSSQSRGFAFIYYDRQEDAEMALKETNGMRLDGRHIRVDFSTTKRAHSPTPGKYMGERRDDRSHDDRRDYRSSRRHYRSRSPRRRSRSHERPSYDRRRRDYSRERRSSRDRRDYRDYRDRQVSRSRSR